MRRIHVVSVLAVAMLAALLGPVGPGRAAEPYTGSVSLSVDYSQLDTEHPTAKLSIGSSKPLGSYRVGVYDETGQLKYSTTYGSLNVSLPAHTTRSYTAYVAKSAPSTGPPADSAAVSAPVTVTNNGYTGSVSLSVDYSQLETEHPTARLSVETSKPLGAYRVGVYDDTGQLKYSTYYGSLNVSLPAHTTRSYTAYVAKSVPSDQPPPANPEAVSTPVTITNNGYTGSVSLSVDYSQLDTEHPTARLSVDTSKALGAYRVGVYDDTGQLKYSTYYGSLNVSLPAHTTRSYTAYVAKSVPSDQPPPANPEAVSAPVTVTSIPAGEHLDGVSLATLEADAAARYGSVLGFCLAVGAVAPGNAALKSSAPDATLVCNAGGLRALVEWMVPIIGTTATAALLWQLAYGHATDPDTQPGPTTEPPGPRRPDIDRTLVASLARRLVARLAENSNPSENFTREEKYPEVADKVAQQCLDQAAELEGATADDCVNKTIFVPGKDAYGAAKNDQAAIAQGMPWKLHWVKGSLNGLPKSWKTNVDQLCGRESRPNPDDECDEYPFYSTNEAGPANDLNPLGGRLAWVPEAENGREGDALNAMRFCPGFESGERLTPPAPGVLGTAFLVVPLPDTVDTTFICGTDTATGG